MSKSYRKISLDITNACCLTDELNISPNARNNGMHNSISLCIKKETNKKDVARRRWGILAKALKSPISSQPSSPTDEISMRRFSSFMLLNAEPLDIDNLETVEIEDDITKPGAEDSKQKNIFIEKDKFDSSKVNNEMEIPDNKKTNDIIEYNSKILDYSKHQNKIQQQTNWYRYSVNILDKIYFVDVPHTSRSFTAADLMGFNNTGNVCVWPSEESLAYYILQNLQEFKGKTVLELGGGMSALAGLMAAKYCDCNYVNLTDGNNLAVENVKISLERNVFGDTIVLCSILQWGTFSNTKESILYDVILSADCLFFDDARSDLIETIWVSLKPDGIAYVMAPKRGGTLDIFVAHAKLKGFKCEVMIIYDQNVWNRHLECLENPNYDANIHYPILILLSKSSL